VTRGGAGPLLLVAVALAAAACAMVAPPVSRLPDGSYRVACNRTLSSCLEAFETICGWHGYDVISASEDRRRGDLRDVPELTIASEAQVRCREGKALFGGGTAAPAVAPAATPAAAEPPPAPTVELLSTSPSSPSCLAPPPDGGATACGGAGPATPAAAAPR